MDFNAARWYLAALIDGEGSVKLAGRHRTRRVVIANTDQAIIDAGLRALELLGLKSYLSIRPSPTSGRPVMYITINGMARCQRLLDVVPLQAPEKVRRLRVAATPAPPRTDIDGPTLQRLYWDEGLTAQQIATLYQRTPTAVGRWFERFGVKKRSMAEAAQGRWA